MIGELGNGGSEVRLVKVKNLTFNEEYVSNDMGMQNR